MNFLGLRKLTFVYLVLALSTAIPSYAKDRTIAITERACIEAVSANQTSREDFVNEVWEKYIGDRKVGGTLNEYYSDKVLFSEGSSKGKDQFPADFDSAAGILRRKLIALMNVPVTREALVEAARAELAQRSARVTRELQDGTLNYDVVIIGGGVHDTIALNGFAGSKKVNFRRVLTVEAEPIYASTFATRRFFMNSSLGPTQYGRRQIPGERENLNYIPGGIIQLPHFVSARYPFSTDLADLLTVLRALSPADILFDAKAEVVSYKRSGDSKVFKLKTEKGTLKAKVVLNITGLGSENFDEKIEISKKASPAVKDGRIQTAGKFLERSTTSQTPYREFVNKTISVIGGGNSADNSVEWLIRALEDLNYGRDNTVVGFPKKIIWHNPRFPEGLSQNNCNEYVQRTRVRYCAIAAAIKSGLIEVVEGRVDKISYSEDRGEVVVIDPKYEYRVDYAIIATGYSDESDKSLTFGNIVEAGRAGRSDPDKDTYVRAPVNSDKDGQIGIVLKDDDRREIPFYYSGTSARITLSEDELAGVSQNSVAIFLLGPKTYMLAVKIAKKHLAGN